jgi:hypothetical protein
MVRLGFEIHGADRVPGFQQPFDNPLSDCASAAGD